MMRSPIIYLGTYQNVFRLQKTTHLKAVNVTDQPSVLYARRLHAKIYLARKYISIHEISTDGVILKKADPYQEFSTYFVVYDHSKFDKPIVATARQINAV
jgi:hypothetical protein